MKYKEPLFRPPAEADSLIFQIAYGCPHNSCKFCGMYKQVNYRMRPENEVLAEISEAGKRDPQTDRVFLADGDCMALSFERLKTVLDALNTSFPRLSRVNLYANGSSILAKSRKELTELRLRKLNTLYVGLESGSLRVLNLFAKKESPEAMTQAVQSAQETGFRCSVMILIGLGGKELRGEHIEQTAKVLNRMQPRLLSALRFIRIPFLPLPPNYTPVTEYEAVEELKEIIARLELNRTVFRANHTSNPIPLAGRFPHDKQILKRILTDQLASGSLDRNGSGEAPLFL